MKKKTLKALEKSICDWDLFAMGTITKKAVGPCALCKRFIGCKKLKRIKGTKTLLPQVRIEYCPVRNRTSYPFCEQTPWEDWYVTATIITGGDKYRHVGLPSANKLAGKFTGLKGQFNDVVDAVEKEIDFLVSLLPEGHSWRD